MSKLRIYGKIRNLPQRARDKVHEWYRQNLTYSKIQKRLKAEFGVSIAKASLSRYYTAHSDELMFPANPEQRALPNEKALAVHVYLHGSEK
ncbi:MAG TPA: hypothetical protein VHW03_05385 [Chthoniobacterales bacterium]|jgi:intein-encoded DNA endonuclease-like protein|nr:hypothetical protein [Chthoniobacterales bacterium]